MLRPCTFQGDNSSICWSRRVIYSALQPPDGVTSQPETDYIVTKITCSISNQITANEASPGKKLMSQPTTRNIALGGTEQLEIIALQRTQ